MKYETEVLHSMKQCTRTRAEVVTECANMVIGCWQHYSDQPLTDVQKDCLHQRLGDFLPVTINTENWQRMAEEQAKRREEQRESDEPCPDDDETLTREMSKRKTRKLPAK